MLSGDQCNGVSELAEGHTYIRGRCKQLGNLYSPNRDDGRCFSNSDYEFLLPTDEFGSPVDVIEKQPEDICRRVSMTPGDTHNENVIQTPTNENPTSLAACHTNDRRSSRDIGVQAFSLEIEEEKTKTSTTTTTTTTQKEHQSQQHQHQQQQQQHQQSQSQQQHQCHHQNHPTSLKYAEASRKEYRKCSLNEPYFVQHDHRPSILLRRDSCHFHKLISPRNEIFVAHCPGSTPLVEFADSCDTYKPPQTDGATTSIDMSNKESRKQCYCFDHHHESMDSTDTAHPYSTTSSDSSTITKIAVENTTEASNPSTSRRPSMKWRSSLVYFMDPCIEDSIETAPEEEYTEKEQTKPLLDNTEMRNAPTISASYEKRNSLRSKSIDETKSRTAEGTAVRNVEGIELASDAVCPFGLAKNLEKQICIIPSRKKKSSGRPSFLKCVTLILIGSAILITSAAIKEAYY